MSTNNMAKRTAAGTLALAVCLGGGALAFAGAASAVISGSATSTAPTASTPAPGGASVNVGNIVFDASGISTTATAPNTITFTLAGSATGVTLSGTPTAVLSGTAGTSGTGSVTAVSNNSFAVTLQGGLATEANRTLTIGGLTLSAGVNAGNGSILLNASNGFASTTLGSVGTDRVITASTGSTTVAAPQITRTTGQALADTTVTLPAAATWSTGDRINVVLPTGLTYSGTPTLTVVKVSGDGTTAPTLSAAAPLQTAAGAPLTNAVPANRQVSFSFTNTKGTTTADLGTAYKLVISGIKADVATTYASDSVATGALNDDTKVQVYYQAQTASSPQTFSGASDFNSTSDVLGYIVPATVDIAAGGAFVNGAGVQSAPDITVKEVTATSLSGALVLRYVDANGVPVPLDSIVGSGFTPTLTVNGTAVTSPAFSTTGNVGEVSVTPTWTSSIDTVVVGNLRFSPAAGSQFVGPIKAEVVSPAAAAVNSVKGNTAKSTVVVPVTLDNNRLGGADRFDTAAMINNAAFPGANLNINRFVLASGVASGIDALSANYVAGVGTDAPLLLTDKDEIPTTTLATFRRLANLGGPVTVTIVGGEAAVSNDVVDQLKDAFPDNPQTGFRLIIQRSAGQDRYETASAVAVNVGAAAVQSYTPTFGAAAKKTAILVSGENPADAVVAGGISYKGGFPLLLTPKTDLLPGSTKDAIDTLGIKDVVIVGGTAVVSAGVEAQLKSEGITVQRLAGADRFETATKVADWARTPLAGRDTATNAGLGYNGAAVSGSTVSHTATSALLGNGSAYADVLAAGQLSGRADYLPVLTTDKDSLSSVTNTWLGTNKDSINVVIGLGGAAVLPAGTLNAAVNAAS